jgi:uncharacterized protein YpuA (DUF1002 family)
MYSDIKSLEQEIEMFRARMKDNGKLCDLLDQVIKEITENRTTSRKDFEVFLKEVSTKYEHINESNVKHQSFLNSFISEFDKKGEDFQAKIDAFMKQIDSDYEKRDKYTQAKMDAFMKQMESDYAKYIMQLSENERCFCTSVLNSEKTLREHYSKFEDRMEDTNFDKFYVSTERRLKSIETKTSISSVTTAILTIILIIAFFVK